MIHFVIDACTFCDACRPECPTGSIFPGTVHYLIDADTCRGCRLCVAVCPVNAILAMPTSSKEIKKPTGASK